MSIFDRPLYGFRFVETRRDDTLQDIALRELGDAARWVDLISYNNLVPPFMVHDESLRQDHVVVGGDLIIVPAPAPVASTPDPDVIFGADIALGKNGELLSDNGDFAFVTGLPNLKQALQNAIRTERGELIFHASYGSLIRRLIGTVNGPTSALLGAQYAKSAVVNDPRVSEVTSSTATISGEVVSVVVKVQAVNGRTVTATA